MKCRASQMRTDRPLPFTGCMHSAGVRRCGGAAVRARACTFCRCAVACHLRPVLVALHSMPGMQHIKCLHWKVGQ